MKTFAPVRLPKKFRRWPRAAVLAASLALGFATTPHVRAQAVWTNADDRDYSGTPSMFVDAFWSYGYVAPDQNGNGGHAGNWSGSLVPGEAGGPTDVILSAPADTLCDVSATLNSLTLTPAGALNMDNNSSLTVTTTVIQKDGELTEGGYSGGGDGIYNNAGTFTKTTGTGTFTLAPTLTFSSAAGSTIAVDAGTLQLPGNNGLLDTVAFVPAAGTTISLIPPDTASATYAAHFQGTLSNGAGTGTVLLSGGLMSGGTAACTLAFTGSVFQWTGGTIGAYQQGALFTNTGVVNVTGDNTPLMEATFTNAGQMIQTGAGGLVIGTANSNGSVTNAATGVFDLQSDAGIGWGGGNGNFFTNAGVLKKSAGTGTSTFQTGLTFNNQGGTIEVDTGTLQLPVDASGGISTGGTFNVAAGAVLDLGGDAHLTGTYTGSGAGTVRFSAGTLYPDKPGATVFNFPGTMFQWTGGTLGGYQAGQVFTNAGTISISGTGTVETDTVFTNQGLITQSGTATLNVGDANSGGSFTNAAGATYNLQSDAGIGQGGYPFNNAGLLTKSAGTGVSGFDVTLTNTGGTVEAASGTMNFTQNIDDISGTTLTDGAWIVDDGATLAFANYTGGVTINQAVVTLNGPNSTFVPINSLTDNQGTFSLLALRQFTTAGDLSDEGAIALDAGSTLHVTGNFTMAAAASPSAAHHRATQAKTRATAGTTPVATANALSITIGGTATTGSTSPGVLQAGGTATLAGDLDVAFAAAATLPGIGDTLTILSATAVSGSFANAPVGTRLTTTDGKGSFVVTYNPASVTLSRFLLPGQTDTVPTVTITSVGDTDAVEGGEPGKVLIRRDGDLTAPLVVYYKVQGDVTVGKDYRPVTGVATILPGAAVVKVKIKAVDDKVHEGSRVAKVKLKAAPGGTYVLGIPAVAKIHIIDNDTAP